MFGIQVNITSSNNYSFNLYFGIQEMGYFINAAFLPTYNV